MSTRQGFRPPLLGRGGDGFIAVDDIYYTETQKALMWERWQRRLNERPRKTLNYKTPAERFQQTIASTG
jgi:hypothetical protein